MTSLRPSPRRRRLFAGMLRLLLAAGVLPLMAPTCGSMTPGTKTFSRNSLIIPMDLCYQAQGDNVSGSGGYNAVGCPQGSKGAAGDVLKAYGLVYQLVRNNVAVYWVISPSKTAATDIDMSVQYNGGPPALKYDWNTGAVSTTAPTSASKIDYRGGPFVIDGSDYARAVAVMTANRGTFSAVNVHVSSVAFQGYVAKTMAGGWSAGGAIPPKLALLDIGSSDAGRKNAEPVIRGYLQRAGLDTVNASGTATGTHGQIYDRLTMGDFLPTSGGDWTTTNLYKNDYQILWVPHWAAPSSCRDCTGFSNSTCPCEDKYPATTVNSALATIGAFSAAGKDVFAECAGVGSFEGVFANTSTTTSFSSIYKQGNPSTHFQTTAPPGLWINAWPSGNPQTSAADLRTGFSSPLMQIGDFPFVASNGAIETFRPSTYQPGVIQFVSYRADPRYDVFTMAPPSGNRGTVVYLAGHSYSGTDGLYEVAGSRLVLNTLFNLGAACVETGVACNTGLLGECSQGVMGCDNTGTPTCRPVKSPQAEVCDGKDNDCNGLVDDGLDVACYDGPSDSLDPSTHLPRGICQAGVSSCVELRPGVWGMSACAGQVLPADQELCNGLDNDCDGRVGNVKGTATPLTQACYTGPSNTVDSETGFPRGICKSGKSTCTSGAWSACAVCPDTNPPPWRDGADHANCQILPHTQICSGPDAAFDMTCTGYISCACTEGTSTPCYDGPPATKGVGNCREGDRPCVNGAWGSCATQVLPKARDCESNQDNDCNGTPDAEEPGCQVAACPAETSELRICRVTGAARYASGDTLPAGKAVGDPKGMCQDGSRACNSDGSLGDCRGTILPSPEICDGQDNDCDGSSDENPDDLCNAGFTCLHGVCVKGFCGVENPCPEGYDCNQTTGKCQRDECPAGSGTVCADGKLCQFGSCSDPCEGVQCADGAVCSSGFCTGGGCYLSGCPDGQSCIQGQCEPDPCNGVACPLGTFCRGGDCVQSCVYVTCSSGQICSADGFCEVDPCRTVTCEAGKICAGGDATTPGTCVDDPCSGQGCGPRQICKAIDDQAVCQDDPCSTVSCPVGACSNGQCYPVTQRDTSHPGSISSSDGAGGCGCGSNSGGPLGVAVLVLFALLRRVRRPFRPGGAARTTLLSLAALLALTAGACKGGDDKSNADYSSCNETCGEKRCIDLNYDSAHCGTCSTVCQSGQICRDGVCGPSSAVAPYVRSVNPDQANHGLLDDVRITLTGDRFEDGATVRAVSGNGSVTYPATLLDATHLQADIDVANLPITQLALRVVNPDHVISNGVPFDVISVAPNITTITPASVTTGTVGTLTVKGTGFAASSLCHARGGSMGEVVMATTPIDVDGAPALSCVFDATASVVTPGTYTLWVVNDNIASSNALTFTVVSSVPTLASITPAQGEVSSAIDVDVSGSGYDRTSQVYFQWGSGTPVAAPTSYIDATHLLVLGYVLPSTAGNGSVTVRNGSQISATSLPFRVMERGGSVQVTSLAVNPTPLYQGQNATFTFSGSGFPTVNRITATAPGGATINATGLAGTASTATGTVALSTLSHQPAGTYSAVVAFSDGTVSPNFLFQVLSNVAVLQSITPAGAKQGTTPTIRFKVGNVLGTPTAAIKNPSTTIAGTSVQRQAPGTDATLWQANFNLTNTNTGTYTLSVQNPGATPSNEISFTVLPGMPTIGSINPACVVQGQTAHTITINGSNFAVRDAYGNALTQVMYSASPTAGFQPIPATVTVDDASKITVTLDSRNAVADTTYYIQVWNPNDPSNGAAQHSASATFRVSSTPCP